MKCPKCDITLPEDIEVCPLCHTPLGGAIKETEEKPAEVKRTPSQDTGRFTAIDPTKDSYDFDIQYTLTFKDAGEIRQSIEDMELGFSNRSEELLHPEKKTEEVQAKSERKVRTREEMEEAAQRAALRRARRGQGKRTDSIKRSHVEKLSRTEREKAAALRAAKDKRYRSFGDAKKNRGFLIGAGVAVVVIALIVGAINLFAGMMDGDIHYPTVYTKNNQIYVYYDKKPQLVSENFISAYAPEEKDTKDTSKTSSNSKKKVEDPKRYKTEVPIEKQLVHVSNDSLYTYFMEDVDLNTGRGVLVYYKNDSPKSRKTIAGSVHYKFEISKDGKSVLYLQNTDDTGYHGELFYWNPDLKEPVKIEDNICADNFKFSQNGLVSLYIKNFNPIVNTGDLCVRSLADGASSESKQIDEKTAFVFGSTPKSDIYIYAKDYDMSKGTYNLYAMKEGGSPELYAKEAFLPPIILEKVEGVYTYSNYHDNFQNISYIDFAANKTNLMAENVTRIERVRIDEGAVIYTKEYETNKSDYYLIASTENASQKIASGVVTIAADNDPQAKVQFDVSDDFSRVAFIGGYDEVNCKGALFTMNIVNGYASKEKRICDDAYGCDVSADGATVRFASTYNKDAATVNLVAYTNSNTVTLAEDVGSGAFTYDKLGEAMVYARNVKIEPAVSGDVECVSTKGKIRSIEEGVSSYGLKKDGTILLLKRDGDNASLYYSNQKGSKIKLIDEGVTKTLSY